MDIQWITDFLVVVAVVAAIFAVFAAELWFLLGLRLAPVRRDLSETKKTVSEISDTLSDINDNMSDLNANCDALNGKFDTRLILLGAHIETDNQPTAGSSQDTADSSGQSEKSE